MDKDAKDIGLEVVQVSKIKDSYQDQVDREAVEPVDCMLSFLSGSLISGDYVPQGRELVGLGHILESIRISARDIPANCRV